MGDLQIFFSHSFSLSEVFLMKSSQLGCEMMPLVLVGKSVRTRSPFSHASVSSFLVRTVT